jgi:hypothetical protein
MAPEQALGEAVDGRSDLFSLGTVAYEMLTAHRPFDADNVPRILTRVAYEEPKPPSSLVAGLPPFLDDVIARVLAKAPGDRYQRGADLAEDLEDVVAERSPRHLSPGQPSQAGLQTQVATWTPAPPPPRERPAGGGSTSRIAAGADWDSPEAALSSLGVSLRPERKRRRTRRRWLAVAAGLGLLVGLGLGAAYWSNPDGWPWSASAAGEPPPGADELPTPTAASTLPPTPEATPEATPEPTPAATPEPTPTPTPEPSPSEAAAPATPEEVAVLALDFDHRLKDGMLKVWIDKKLLLEQPLAGDAWRKPETTVLRKGYVKAELKVTPGQHDIWVEVRWDDNIKSDGITARFKAGDTKTLKVRVGRFRKNVSLEWS